MKKILSSKRFIFVLGVLSLLAIIYLTVTLSSLEFKPAAPFVYENDFPIRKLANGGSGLFGVVFVIAILAVVVLIIFFLLSADQRKKFIRKIAQLSLVGVIIFLILGQLSTGNPVEQQQVTSSGNSVITPTPTIFQYIFITPEPTIVPSVFIAPEVPAWSSYVVTLAIMLVGAGGWAWWNWRIRKKKTPYEALANIAQVALNDIEAGGDWGDAIMDSYFRMTKAVADWLGIRRRKGMTPAEYADTLIAAHLPSDAVLRLTALFERIRYGGKKSTRKNIKEAVDCLTAILDFCKENK
jgi:hypothetical protein